MSEDGAAGDLQPTRSKMCPICGEPIAETAKKCIHCEEFIEKSWLGFRGKTLWDVMALLIVPMVLAAGGFLLNSIADERQKAIEQAETERQKARDEDRGRETALQSYFEKMTALRVSEGLDQSGAKPEVLSIARVKTLTLIRDLDSRRKGLLLQFLHESDLITRGGPSPALTPDEEQRCSDPLPSARDQAKSVVSLRDADLRGVALTNAILHEVVLGGADLREADLRTGDLRHASLVGTDLRGANLGAADMDSANLDGAFLIKASLVGASLKSALLRCAFLSGANLQAADLRGAHLFRASLVNADLRAADLRGASLEYADLRGASLAKALTGNDQFRSAILCETVLPNGETANRDCTADSSSSTETSLEVVPIVSSETLVGTYTVDGKNPGGGGYFGTCLILQEEGIEGRVEILWTIVSNFENQQRFQGIGELTEDQELYVMYKGNFYGDGTWSLMSDGSLHGSWRGSGTKEEGTEIWTPVEAK